MLAGTVVLGVEGTMATLSDTASLPAEAGAGSLSFDGAGPSGTLQLHLGNTLDLPVRASLQGTAPVALRLSVVGGSGSVPCADLPAVALSVEVRSSTQEPLRASLCELVRPATVLTLDGGAPTIDLTLRVRATPLENPSTAPVSWTGALRLTLVQTPGGFSDSQDVDVHVVAPPGQGGANRGGGTGNADTGNGGIRNGGANSGGAHDGRGNRSVVSAAAPTAAAPTASAPTGTEAPAETAGPTETAGPRTGSVSETADAAPDGTTQPADSAGA
jgi:hypothetical protein